MYTYAAAGMRCLRTLTQERFAGLRANSTCRQHTIATYVDLIKCIIQHVYLRFDVLCLNTSPHMNVCVAHITFLILLHMRM